MSTSRGKTLLVSHKPGFAGITYACTTYEDATAALLVSGPWGVLFIDIPEITVDLARFLADNPRVLPKRVVVMSRTKVDAEKVKVLLKDSYKNITKDGFEFTGKVTSAEEMKLPQIISTRGDFSLDRSLYFTAHAINQFRMQTKEKVQRRWADRAVIEFLTELWKIGEPSPVKFAPKFKKYGLDSIGNEHRYSSPWLLSKASNDHIVTVHWKNLWTHLAL